MLLTVLLCVFLVCGGIFLSVFFVAVVGSVVVLFVYLFFGIISSDGSIVSFDHFIHFRCFYDL